MSERGDLAFCLDIEEAIKAISVYIAGIDYSSFLKDGKTRDAVVRNLEIIGDAAKKLHPSFKKIYPDLPWKEMAGMRDKLIHQYFGTNYEVVWAIVSRDLPKLRAALKPIIEELQTKNRG